MKKGDKVIYIFDPYDKDHPIDAILLAQIIKTPEESFFKGSDYYAIHPIERIYGESGMHDQDAMKQFLHEIGDKEVIRIIFERKLVRRKR